MGLLVVAIVVVLLKRPVGQPFVSFPSILVVVAFHGGKGTFVSMLRATVHVGVVGGLGLAFLEGLSELVPGLVLVWSGQLRLEGGAML